jgi:hypothetical protein
MIVYSWDGNAQVNDGVNFAAWFVGPHLGLPEVQVDLVPRHGRHPRIGGITRQGLEMLMEVEALAGSADTLRTWFDAEDATPRLLVVTDEDGGNARYWRALCYSFLPTTTPYIYLVKLRIDGDVRLRSVTPTTQHWDVTSSSFTWQTIVTNGVAGINDDAYPIITITPRAYATDINNYRRFIAVNWRAATSASAYPVDITAAGLDTRVANTNFASTAGNDIRVYVDGVETDYWLHNPNTTTTKVFVNLDWQPARSGTLVAGFNAGTLGEIALTEGIAGFPDSGLLLIDNELFAYTGRDLAAGIFDTVIRAARGTSAASHSAGATVTLIQHEIWIEYGSSSPAAASVDNTRKPMFNLATSTNTSWDYDDFHKTGEPRAAAWSFTNALNVERYGGSHATAANPYVELGIASATGSPKTAISGDWTIYNPCGLTAANFQNGEFYHGRLAWWSGSVRSSVDGATYSAAYTIASSTNDTWNSWSQNVALAGGTRYVNLSLRGYGSMADPSRLECADVTLSLDSSVTPTVVIGAEQSFYRLKAHIVIMTTNDGIYLDVGLALNESLEIDTDTDTVTLLSDGSSQYQGLTVEGLPRNRLLRLQPGANELLYGEAGVVDVDVDIEFERRYRV